MSYRIHLTIYGKVQGVFYRASARQVALNANLVGYVMNLPDGRVEIIAEGPRPALHDLIKWCKTGPPLSKVDRVDVAWENPTGEFHTFRAY